VAKKLLYSARTNPIWAAHLKRRQEVEHRLLEALRLSDESLLVDAMNDAQWEYGLFAKARRVLDTGSIARVDAIDLDSFR
jgi:hypothetical protein